ncbi:Citrate synthase (si), partial [hydrothermal vent metagenome]
MGDIQAPPGLAGVVVTDTILGGVRGEQGFYHYREFSATELASRRSLEDVWYLFQMGHLPDDIQAKDFATRVSAYRAIPRDVQNLIDAVARLGSGRAALAWVRTAASILGESLDIETWLGRPLQDVAHESERLIAALPTAIATGWRSQQGLGPVAPDPQLPLAADFLRMLTGTRPEADTARAFEQYLILTIDHGLNASTFAARSVASTGADIGAAVVAGIGSLSGPLHGGAPSLVLDMLQDIGSIDRARPWVRDRLASGEPVMGFGHR